MTTPTPQTHLTQLQLMNIAQGVPVREEIRAHVDHCIQCREALKEAHEPDALMTPTLLMTKAQSLAVEYDARIHQDKRRLWLRLMPLGVAALLALLLVPSIISNQWQSRSGTRLKGSLSIKIYQVAGEELHEVTRDHYFSPASLIRVEVIAPNEGTLEVRSAAEVVMDGVDLTASKRVVLPSLLELECTGPQEELTFIFTPQDEEISPVVKRVELLCKQAGLD